MAIFGIDVSSDNGPNLPSGNVGDFVMVKATEGHSYVNPDHNSQVTQARQRGDVVGHYHFLWPGAISAQVQWFLKNSSVAAGDVLAIDWETTEAGTRASCAEKDQALALLAAARPRNRVLLYCNRDYWLHLDTTGHRGDGLWIADPSAPTGHPGIKDPWVIHQFGETAGVDRNVYAGTLAQLRAWAMVAAPAPKPAPPAKPPYTVRKGDTLTSIAAAHKVKLAALEKANPQIHNPNEILPGEKITIP